MKGLSQEMADWNRQPFAHAHYVRLVSGQERSHFHLSEWFTYPVNGSSHDGHVHTFQGHTFMRAGHFHRFLGTSGPAVPMADGGHYHPINIVTDEEPFSFQGGFYSTVLGVRRHIHRLKGISGPGIGYAEDVLEE